MIDNDGDERSLPDVLEAVKGNLEACESVGWLQDPWQEAYYQDVSRLLEYAAVLETELKAVYGDGTVA